MHTSLSLQPTKNARIALKRQTRAKNIRKGKRAIPTRRADLPCTAFHALSAPFPIIYFITVPPELQGVYTIRHVPERAPYGYTSSPPAAELLHKEKPQTLAFPLRSAELSARSARRSLYISVSNQGEASDACLPLEERGTERPQCKEKPLYRRFQKPSPLRRRWRSVSEPDEVDTQKKDAFRRPQKGGEIISPACTRRR